MSTLEQMLETKAVSTNGGSLSSFLGDAAHSPPGKGPSGKAPKKSEKISSRKIAAG